MKRIAIVLLCLMSNGTIAQINCNVYKYKHDDDCFKACEIANEAAEQQGSGLSQKQFDQAIKLCPTSDYAYVEKSVPYLKRGDFITWRKLIDQGVALNPAGHLGYRGWCRYQFLRDYKGAIQDIEKLDSLVSYDLGYSSNGDYHLNFARALCYKAVGEKQKAMNIMEEQLSKEGYTPMIFDYYHLGVVKYELGDTKGAMETFKKQIAYNDYMAETYYYQGLIYKKEGNRAEYMTAMQKAKAFYLKGYHHRDSYTIPCDQVYLADIESELKAIK